MSFYFALSFTVSTSKLANETGELFVRDSRPIFEEDVPPHLTEQFRTIDEVEFPTKLLVSGNQIFIVWNNIENVGFDELRPFLKCEEIDLQLAYEIDSYADSSDQPEEDMAGCFIYFNQNKYVRCSREQANAKFPNDLVSDLSNIDNL